MTDVGFIGLGIMGGPMAGHLLAAGHKLYLNSRCGAPQGLIDQGGVSCASGREIAEKADVIFIMVPDTPEVEAVLFGPEGVARGLTPGKTVIDMSSISPIETKKFAAAINELGCEYLDAPVSGGEVCRRRSQGHRPGGPVLCRHSADCDRAGGRIGHRSGAGHARRPGRRSGF
jgi:2-hydroxy-3-oxopropionate reductase